MNTRLRQQQAKVNITEFFSNIMRPESEDFENQGLLFPEENSDYQPELELPIKVDDNLSRFHLTGCKRDLQDLSISGSEQMENREMENSNSLRMIEEENAGDKDLDELMNNQNEMNFIDSLLIPCFVDSVHLPFSEWANHLSYFEEPNLKIEEEDHGYQLLKGSSKQNAQMFEQIEKKQEIAEVPEAREMRQDPQIQNKLKVLYEEKIDLLHVMTDFRALAQTIQGVMNLHKIGKKSEFNKSFSNVFCILTKESQKLFEQLEPELVTINEKLHKANSQSHMNTPEPSFGITKELANTSPGCNSSFKQDSVQIKIEEGTMPRKMRK